MPSILQMQLFLLTVSLYDSESLPSNICWMSSSSIQFYLAPQINEAAVRGVIIDENDALLTLAR